MTTIKNKLNMQWAGNGLSAFCATLKIRLNTQSIIRIYVRLIIAASFQCTQGWMHCKSLRYHFIIYSLLIIKHYSISLNTLFVPVGSITCKYCPSPTFLWGFAPWTSKHSGACKQAWHFHPEGLPTLNISTDRCRFLMPAYHVESQGCRQEVYRRHVQVTSWKSITFLEDGRWHMYICWMSMNTSEICCV